MSFYTQEAINRLWFSCELFSLRLTDDQLDQYIQTLKNACYHSITSYLEEKQKLNETLNETYGNDNAKGGLNDNDRR